MKKRLSQKITNCFQAFSCKHWQNKHFLFLFLVAFLFQIIFWFNTQNIKPEYQILAKAPQPYFLKLAAFGDEQFLFRSLAFQLQNSGDVYAGFIALKNYDYLTLYNWLNALDSLDSRSNLMPSLASYYYSQTQKKSDSIYIVNYLSKHAEQDLNKKWWWIFQAINIAQENLNDNELALKLANQLAQNNSKDAPLWTKQISAFIYAKQGENCLAFRVIKNLLDENISYSDEEINFMKYFIENRLKKLKNQNFDLRKC